MLGAVPGSAATSREPRGARPPRMIVVGPTPPPVHGVAFATAHVLAGLWRADALAAHLDTGEDPRPVATTGRFDLTNVRLGLRHVGALARLLARHPDARVYVPISQVRWGYVRDAVLIAVARLARRPVVVHLHGGRFRDFYEESGPLMRALIRWTLRDVSEAWVLTPGHADIFDGLVPRDRVRVLENASEDMRAMMPRTTDHSGSGARAAGAGAGDSAPEGDGIGAVAAGADGGSPEDGPLRVLFLSNMMREKGLIDLLDALELLGPQALPLDLRIAGQLEDDVARELAPRAARLAERGIRVEAVGLRVGAEKGAELTRADVLVLPSPNEGQPIVLLEAMSAGLPIVSTTLPGIAHTVRDEREGLLVPPGDPAAIAAALERLAADPELRGRLGRAGRERYESSYTPEAHFRAIAELVGAADSAGGA